MTEEKKEVNAKVDEVKKEANEENIEAAKKLLKEAESKNVHEGFAEIQAILQKRHLSMTPIIDIRQKKDPTPPILSAPENK